MMACNYDKQDIGQRATCITLTETVAKQASKVGHPVKLDAEFETVTESEREKLDQQVFPDKLFTSDVNLAHSKKAFLNFMKGFDDFSQCEKIWGQDPPKFQQATTGMYVH